MHTNISSFERRSLLQRPVQTIMVSIVLFGVLVLGAAFSYHRACRLIEIEAGVHESQETLVELQASLTAITRVESATRGFFLTKQQTYITAYKGAAADAKARNLRLLQLTAQNPEQEALVKELARRFAGRLQTLDQTIARADPGSAGRAVVQPEVGLEYMADIKLLVEQAAAQENARLQAREAEARKSGAIARWSVIVGSSSDFLFLALLGCVIMRASEQRKESEAAMRSTEEHYRRIFEQAVPGFYRATFGGRFVSVNRSLAEILNYDTPEQMISAIADIGLQLHVDPARCRELLQILRDQGSVQDFECELYRRDGTRIWISETAWAVQDANSFGGEYHGTIEDITERKTLEQQFHQAQKMEAVGRLAGGIAHDFNNSLGVITGYVDLLRTPSCPVDRRQEYLEHIEKAAGRATSLTHQLLAFSRKQVIQPQVVNLSEIAAGAETMLRRLIGEDIELILSCDHKLGHISADVGQVEQILMNLVVNARDAMPKGGKLFMTTSNVDLNETSFPRFTGAKPGRYILLSVRDTGIGIDPSTLAHIFEPFFTTKEPGKGTGLGLSTVYGIVKQNHGYISVSSEPSHGTVFKIYLPSREQEALPLKREIIPVRPPRGGWETILLVEDEQTLRELTRNCLESAGYRVLDAPNGPAAMQTAADKSLKIDLLLTDVIMPEMSGGELARAIALIRPTIKVLYMSGYTDDLITQHGVLDAGTVLLEKPFTLESLLSKVHTVLERQAYEATAGQ